MVAGVHVRLLGATEVRTSSGERVTAFGGAKARQVLGMLAVQPGTAIGKERLAEQLWDGTPPRSWAGTLESYVCVLRRSIGEAGRSSAIRTTACGYVLDDDRVTVDVAEVRTLVGRARAGRGSERVALVEAAAAWAMEGELLASEPYAAWADEQRGRLHHELVSACVDTATAAHASGDDAAAVRLAEAAISLDGLAEPAWEALMVALAAQERHGEALRAYARLREGLADELGIEPSPRCQALYMDLLRSRPSSSRGGRSELATLMRLLRQALEDVPGIVVPTGDELLSRVAVGVLQQSA